MILLGIEDADTDEDIDWLCRKIVALRIFDDADGVMNLPITDVPDSGILLVSQFTLMASTKKGNRPQPSQLYPRLQARGGHPHVREVYPSAFRPFRQGGSNGRVRRQHAGGAGQRRSRHHHY